MSKVRTIAVIGAGAAGYFSAINAKKSFPKDKVVIYEKSQKVLSKVKISGGGRCNVTNNCQDIKELSGFYPRGGNQLRKAFSQFSTTDTIEWFESRNVPLKVYPDNCIFPVSNNSQSIIDCFLKEANDLGVELKTGFSILRIQPIEDQFCIVSRDEEVIVDRVILAIGGQPKMSGMQWMESLGLKIIEPLPSLFTFNMPGNPVTELMGNVVEKAHVKIEGTKLSASGPLLITHWGMSGPAILKLSAWGARILADKKYEFKVFVNWLDGLAEIELRKQFGVYMDKNQNKMLPNANPFPITNKIWVFLLQKHGVPSTTRWKDLTGKLQNKLVNALLFDTYDVKGKTTFKEEFVTAGGVDLSEVNFKTMESKKVPGLFFAGEILDIDGITGGFNFQAAWTTGFIAGTNVGY